jgi:prepilin-type N-terminal cleavage/methylation domain-containing protein
MNVFAKRPKDSRRGVTLIEMLVAVALLVLMMTIIVQVFGAATGAVSTAKTLQDLDANLRQLDATIRQDLQNVTAKFTPPLNPKDNLGYFEYGENSFADNQGEDTDDYVRFTAKAPEGQYFTGRFYVSTTLANLSQAQQKSYFAINPITITSQYAEIVYFLRNGNLYRRVLLVVPERQSSIGSLISAFSASTDPNYASTAIPGSNGLPLPLSYQGVNDISARPPSVRVVIGALPNTNFVNSVVLNTLGDLTNRENRFSYSRFGGDFGTFQIAAPGAPAPPPGDGILDDLNPNAGSVVFGNGVPDFYPTLYPAALSPNRLGEPLIFELPRAIGDTNMLRTTQILNNPEIMAFPYIFPGAYSVADFNTTNWGWIHTPDPSNPQGVGPGAGTFADRLAELNKLNHNPIEIGDSLPPPTGRQTWWGFPTWRETMCQAWTDPWYSMCNVAAFTNGSAQPFGLNPFAPGTSTPTLANVLPPMSTDPVLNSTTGTRYRTSTQPYVDTNPNNTNLAFGNPTLARVPAIFNPVPADGDGVWRQCWEDDLIMTGVRSFDIKAYDDSFPGYVDLGWGDDLRQYIPYANYANVISAVQGNGNPLLIDRTPDQFLWPPVNTLGVGRAYATQTQTYAHEGRIPPLTTDRRFDPNVSNPNFFAQNYSSDPNLVNNAGFFRYTGNVGDDNAGVVRLRRVWDTWSTDYSRAPATGYDPNTFAPIGPPFTPPIYPSYPPPYPMPLRGIQIQVRVVDPKSEQVKVLTIRQDFTDKL